MCMLYIEIGERKRKREWEQKKGKGRQKVEVLWYRSTTHKYNTVASVCPLKRPQNNYKQDTI